MGLGLSSTARQIQNTQRRLSAPDTRSEPSLPGRAPIWHLDVSPNHDLSTLSGEPIRSPSQLFTTLSGEWYITLSDGGQSQDKAP